MNRISMRRLSFTCFVCGTGTVVAVGQVGTDPVCLDTEFLRYACDNLAKVSDPECNDVILTNEMVTDALATEGCGQRSRTTATSQCKRAKYVYNPETGQCTFDDTIVTDNFSSNYASGDNCGAC